MTIHKKIESLTPEQTANLDAFREECLHIGRSTAPANRQATEQVISAMYQVIGEKPPYFWWCDGPATGSMVRMFLKDKLRDNLGANLWANLWDNLRDNLGANLRDNLGANLRDNLGANLWANLWDNLVNNLESNLWANLWDNFRANLWDNLGDNLRANLVNNLESNLWANLWDNLESNLESNLWANLWDNLESNLWDNLESNLWDNLGDNLWNNLDWLFWGQHELHWQAFYLWTHNVLRPMYTEDQVVKLNWWWTLSKSCGWWHPYQGVCFVCERPAKQQVDDRGLLHCDNGPALLCRDGWPVYAVHGVRVPAKVIEDPASLTVEEIDRERNTEVKRVMIDRYGWPRYLAETGAVVIHERHNDIDGTHEALLQAADGGRHLICACPSTAKVFAMRVPREVKTCDAAQKWLAGEQKLRVIGAS